MRWSSVATPSQRGKKEQGIAELFATRFEAALAKLTEGLHKKGTVKLDEKVLERLGRLREKYTRAAQYYEVSVVAQDPDGGNATAIARRRIKPISETLPGVYCLRTNQAGWDEAKVWRTYTIPTDLEVHPDALIVRSLPHSARPVYGVVSRDRKTSMALFPTTPQQHFSNEDSARQLTSSCGRTNRYSGLWPERAIFSPKPRTACS